MKSAKIFLLRIKYMSSVPTTQSGYETNNQTDWLVDY